MILMIVLIYFGVLFGVSRWTSRRVSNETFYRADRRSPWFVVAFGMVGASITGVTFVSVPGMVLTSQMTYLQTCMGFILGYLVVAFVLLPLYYRLNLTSIYTYLGQRLGRRSHQTGSWFFLLSKMCGAAVRFYVVCVILQRFAFEPLGMPFVLTVILLVTLIWLYTRRGGIKTLVWTDSLQTLCLYAALLIIMYQVMKDLAMTPAEAVSRVADSPMSRIFVFDDWASRQHFMKQFISGIFIVIVMTGLDQDMMQKNLTCRTLRSAQKDMCCYGVAFLPVNFLFLALGVLLVGWYQQHGQSLPASPDELLPTYVTAAATSSSLTLHPSLLEIVFVIGIVAASLSSADSALTSLTTICCVDIVERPTDEKLRKRVHLMMCVVFIIFILLFSVLNTTNLIDTVYILVGYTYGPLLGLFAYGLLTKKPVWDAAVPVVAIASPLLCFAIDYGVGRALGYRFGYELLMVNGLLTYLGLRVTSLRCRSN